MSKHNINHDKSNSQTDDTYEKIAQNIDNENLHTLYEVIIDESNKPDDEIDKSMIDECLKLILEIKGIDPCSEDEKERLISNIMQNYDELATVNVKNNKFKFKLKMVACVIVVILTLATTVAYALGFEPLKYIKEIFELSVGESTIIDGIKYIRSGEILYYDTIEILCKKQNLDILYPSYLPNDDTITNIRVNTSDETSNYIFEFSSDMLSYRVYGYKRNSFDALTDEFQIYETTENVYHIFYAENIYTSYFEYNDYHYILQYSEYEELTKILDNMKGYK